MKTILVATDFLPVSVNAAIFAADMAARIGARLTLLHAYWVPIPVGDVPYPVVSLEQIREEVDGRMQQLKQQLNEHRATKIEIDTKSIEGETVSALRNFVTETNPYAVVIGSESRHGIEQVLSGAKTFESLRKITAPIFIIPPTARFSGFRNVGLACDLRDVRETLRVNEIATILDNFDAKLHILHVTDDEEEAYTKAIIEESADLQALISNLNPKYHFIHTPFTEEGLIASAVDLKLDLLIIIPKTRNLLARAFRRSHSKELVRSAIMPILSLHE